MTISMALPQIADGKSLQIWRVAANIFNKKSRTADKGLSCTLEVGKEERDEHSGSIKSGEFLV
jgi:hypothetical protein